MVWVDLTKISSKKYVCGHCNSLIASELGYYDKTSPIIRKIYICPHCEKPTFFEHDSPIPGVAYGNEIESIDDEDTQRLYNEARNCCSTASYTASVLCCRKLLMNIAVSKGADENLPFIRYVEFLAEKNYIPPGSKEWVDHIRKKGNEATHEIAIMKKEDAEELITFIEMLLRIIYEFPNKIKSKSTP